jgi:hypothetical protein
LSFIPLALAAITPAMLAVVIFLLSLERGLLRAGMFMAGRLVTYAGWSIVLFIFTDRVFDLSPGSHSDFILLLKVILGLLLIAMAIKIALGGDDPEALPSKIVARFNKISFLQLFGLGVLVSIFQVRHILLLFVGLTGIIVTETSVLNTVLATLILILMINASQLIIIGLDLALSTRAEAFFQSVEAWLTHNNRRVAAFISLIGIFLLWDGIRGLGIFG